MKELKNSWKPGKIPWYSYNPWIYYEKRKDTIARPHIAKAIIDAGYNYDKEYIFEHFIGNDCPAYIPSVQIDTKEGVKLLKKHGAVVVLAHPVLLKKSSFQDVLALGFDGLEGIYPMNSEEDTENS